MKEICENIDLSIQSVLDNIGGIKFFGLSKLIQKEKQTSPITVNDNKQVSIDNRFDGIVYHRVINSTVDEPEDEQWGVNAMKLYKTKIRTILAHKVEWFDESFVFDFANAIPQFLNIDGYKKIDVADNLSITGKDEQVNVYKTEFEGAGKEINYDKHILPWNIYALEYDVNFIKC